MAKKVPSVSFMFLPVVLLQNKAVLQSFIIKKAADKSAKGPVCFTHVYTVCTVAQ